jgi:hypothetical protein
MPGPRRLVLAAAALASLAAAGSALGAPVLSLTADTPDPRVGDPVALGLVAADDTPGQVTVWVGRDRGACATALQVGGDGQLLVSGSALPAQTTVARDLAFTPTRPGRYRVCAWTAPGPGQSPTQVGSIVVGVRRLDARITRMAVSGPARAEAPVTLLMRGSPEAGGRLVVVAQFGSAACPATPDDALDALVVADQRVSGAFSSALRFTPSAPGPYRLCAWLSPGASGVWSARRGTRVTVGDSAAALAARPSAPAAVPAAGRLLLPRGGDAMAPGLALPLRWAASQGARFYNVQLYRGSRKVLSLFPDAARATLPPEALQAPGRYTLVIWSSTGPKSAARYAPTPWVTHQLAVGVAAAGPPATAAAR